MKKYAVLLGLLVTGTAMAQFGGQSGQNGSSSTDSFISRLDKDGDGKVSESEFDGPSDHFSQFDADGDGYISTTEVPSGPPSNSSSGGMSGNSSGGGMGGGMSGGGMSGGMNSTSGADFVKRLDKDGDSKISESEFDGPTNIFSELDKDSDGYLSEDEAPTGAPPMNNNSSGGGRSF